jgi:signal transduction histidine kinase
MTEDEIEQFSYAASHDLKAPLRAIENLAQWIEEDLDKPVKPEVAEHLQMLRKRAKRMGSLVDALLEYSRADRGGQAVAPVDLGALCAEIVAGLPAKPGIRVVIAEGMPALDASEAPLRQALAQLFSNAFKHHDRAEGLLRISARQDGACVEICVQDDGPGIDSKHQEKIFQPFHTLKPKDEVEGNGLGLAIAKKIVESRGGRLCLESAGRGSAFRLLWPQGA